MQQCRVWILSLYTICAAVTEMALPACRKCGHEVAEETLQCPYCGIKNPKKLDAGAEFRAQAILTLLFFAVAVAAILLSIFFL